MNNEERKRLVEDAALFLKRKERHLRLKAIRIGDDHFCMLLANHHNLKCFQLWLLDGECLPKDAFIRSVNYQPEWRGWLVVFESDSFAPVEPGHAIPIMDSKWNLHAVEIK